MKTIENEEVEGEEEGRGNEVKPRNKKQYRSWAYCYRVHLGINTNMAIENFNKILKYCYLKGKRIKRLDKIICAILYLLNVDTTSKNRLCTVIMCDKWKLISVLPINTPF